MSSLLQVLARRAIHSGRNELIRLQLQSHPTRCSSRSSSYVAQSLISRKQSNHESSALVNLTVSPFPRCKEHLVASDLSTYSSKCSSVEIRPPFSSWTRQFSSNLANKESQHLSSVDASNLQDGDSDSKVETQSVRAGAPTKDEKGEKATSVSSSTPKPDKTPGASTASKPVASATDEKESHIIKKAKDATIWAVKALVSLLAKTPGVLWFYLTHPAEFRKKLTQLKEAAVKEAHHYWMGSKLLAADIRTARHILGRTLRGSTLSRRERKQLLRTVTDVFRLVPMSIFVLVPFMEFALPFALKLFPNMLPSTFQDSLKEEEKMKGELQMRISMASFFQDTLAELAKEQKKSAALRKHNADDASDAESIETEKEASAESFLEFLKKARTGERIPPNVIIKFAGYFSDNLTLDNMERMQLIPMCKYMGILPYGNDNLLRFQLRHKIRVLKDDDQRILWEGIDSLTKMELREACRERGMRSTGLSKEAYKKSLQEWLELSVKQNVPISLLIMSRTFYLHDEMISGESQTDDGSKRVAGLADAMSGIDKDVLNEIVLEMASSKEKSSNADVMKIQLEVLEHQNELIKEEQQERDAAAKEKAEEERKRIEQKKDEESEAQKIGSEGLLHGNAAASNEDMEAEKESVTKTSVADSSAGVEVSAGGKVAIEKTEGEEEEQIELSAEEIEAISQLVSPDPLHREREDLQRIKNAIQAETKPKSDAEKDFPDNIREEQLGEESSGASLETMSAISPSEPMYTDEAPHEALKSIKDLDEIVEIRKEAKSVVSLKGDTGEKIVVENPGDESAVGDKKLQKAIDRLKSKVESMVGKIETHLSDVEVKIGNKFHLLDKDMDGVLTREEMVQVLQTVLKRELTFDEAMAIASDMFLIVILYFCSSAFKDTNEDGVFSLSELQNWAETNIIIKLAEDGREKDVDELITKRLEDFNSSEKKKLDVEAEEWKGI
ncbi:hypothetical protein HJC23_011314 [Cyclotella cryptica]|uniref:Mitochondrial proton/calcium exchanger protein n=1 Tax=Cyclotella cryptica TaxID=29204 RepID=A0ABD3QZ57_9STRA